MLRGGLSGILYTRFRCPTVCYGLRRSRAHLGMSLARNDTMPRMKCSAVAFAVLVLGCLASPAQAQSDYPNRTVRIIAGFVPASSTHIIAPLMAGPCSRLPGQQFVVETRPGAAARLAPE